jgi:alanine racemase
MQETTVEIHLGNLRANALAFKKATDRFMYAVVKADAYGHGAVQSVAALYTVADGFAVALIDEAIAIKQAAGGKEILVFTPPFDEGDVVVAARNGFSLSVTDLRSARLIVQTAEKYGLRVRAHVKVNTGMNRYGVCGDAVGKICALLKRSGQVCVEGVYSHLYSHDKTLCEAQRLRFWRSVKICRRYFPLARAHLSSTFGACLGKDYLFDGIRIGLGLYGYFPEGEPPFSLLPVMRAYAPCVGVRKLCFGGAGYGGERQDLFGKKVSILRSGYADGLGVSGEQSGLLPPIVGQICMDVCLAKQEYKKSERALLFDDAQTVASIRGTSVYEVLCRMGLRAKKMYLE